MNRFREKLSDKWNCEYSRLEGGDLTFKDLGTDNEAFSDNLGEEELKQDTLKRIAKYLIFHMALYLKHKAAHEYLGDPLFL